MPVNRAAVRPNLGGLVTVHAHGNTGTTETIDLALGNYHSATLDNNCTFTFTGATSGKECSFTLVLTQDGTGSRTVTWPGSVSWPGASTPTLATAAASIDVFVFWTVDGGSVWYGKHATAISDISGHTGDTSDAHDASAISVADSGGNFAGTDVEAVLAELQDNIDAVGGGSGYIGYIRLEDQKAANTASGGFTTGAYRTRTLNTEVTDTNNDCSLASDQITLAAGTYDCLITAPAVFVSNHKARLRNVTDGTTVLVGTSAYAPIVSASDGSQTDSIVRGRFTIGASKALEVQHACSVTRATNGFGVQSNLTEIEVYCVAEFWRVS